MKNYVHIRETIRPFKEEIEVPGDKSLSIRCVLLASQAIGTSKIYNLLESEDVINSLKSIKKLGVNFKKFKKFYKIYGFGLNGFNTKKKIIINAGNSGTLARLILGLLVNSKNWIKIVGDKSLSKRDFKRITEPLKLFGANIKSKNNSLPVEVYGTKYLRPINYFEKLGSAQCKSVVMLAAIKTPGITKIRARKSRNHTEILYKSLKIPIKIKKGQKYDQIQVSGISNFNAFDYNIPGDISSCSFFLVLALLANNSKLIIKKVNINSTRTGIIKILNRMNAKIKFKNKKKYKGELISDIIVESKNYLKGVNCPKSINSSAIDEFLVIFLVAAKANGVSSFKNLSELNKKESPRLDIAVKFLKKIGVKVLRNKDNIKIFGNPNLTLKGKYKISNFRKDHRIFMMSCVAALTFGGDWIIEDKDSTKTSFPNFFKLMNALGAKIT